MHENRESFYRCTFSSPRSLRVGHVRAWDAGEAEQLFRVELETEGVAERGTIEVQDFDGTVSHRGAYRP